jgi:1,4-alpha-glucan branching enzyme
VLRENFQIGVTRAGKYKEILNSDDVKYGGLGNTNLEAICSENEPYNGREHSVKVLLPPSGVVVFSYTPYTGIELEEMKIRAEALKAKQLAEKEARAAQELKRKAEEEAARAVEAEKQAKAAAKEALTAKIKAEKQAEEAARISSRIDAETRKKLEELRAE